jgi:hypothetical protein
MWAREVLMMPGYLVLLEETADREAEARVVIHGASGDHFRRGCDAGVCALDTKKMVAHVWTPRGGVLLLVVVSSLTVDGNDTCLLLTEQKGLGKRRRKRIFIY